MPINRGDSRVKSCFSLFTHSSPLFTHLPLSYIFRFLQADRPDPSWYASSCNPGVERLAYANLGAQITDQHRKSFVQNLENIRTDEPFARFIIFRNTEAALQHRFKIIYLEERKIALLDAIYLGIGKPVRRLLMAKLIHNLCIELVINDG